MYLLKCTNKNFDIIAVIETRISKKTSLTSNIDLNNYSFKTTPTESTAGGTMLYVSNRLSYKPGTDLNMYKKNQLESTFIEIINSKKSNIVVGCVYKHPNMDVLDFNSLINQLLDKISKGQKQIFLLGDFNINLLSYDEHQPTNEFLDSLASNSIIPYILQPGLLVIQKPSLTIFFLMHSHLKQCLETLLQLNPLCNKSNILERDWSKLNKENFILDYFDKNWSEIF